jgi:hypothetical protein
MLPPGVKNLDVTPHYWLQLDFCQKFASKWIGLGRSSEYQLVTNPINNFTSVILKTFLYKHTQHTIYRKRYNL